MFLTLIIILIISRGGVQLTRRFLIYVDAAGEEFGVDEVGGNVETAVDDTETDDKLIELAHFSDGAVED